MKKENIIIIILVILLLALSGYIIYDKTNNENIKEETTNNTVNSEINKPLNKEFLSKFSGKYSYEAIYNKDNICSTTNDYPKAKTNFELKEDGTYTYNFSIDCAGGTTSYGNYYIGNDKIYLIANDCPINEINENQISYPNCHPVYEINYSITNNKIELYSLNNSDNSKTIFEKN